MPIGGPATQSRLAPANAAMKSEFAVPRNLSSLRIEHDGGPKDEFSEVTGRVTDLSGAAISGAAVTLRDPAGLERETRVGVDGRFNLPAVAAGRYDLSVSAPGFQTSRQTIDLKPRDLALLDSVLQVGAGSETVTVEASAPTLQTSESEVSSSAAMNLPSHLEPANMIAKGKRMLSLDSAGTLFLSRNRGKSWKRIKPVWTGKVTQIGLVNPSAGESDVKVLRKTKPAAAAADSSVFQLTTESGTIWVSEDGSHWHGR
jgi:hypothetical protein